MNTSSDFIKALTSPDRRFGEVPFYWWNGSPLNKERLKEQIRMLAEKGLAGVQINYAHINRGGENNLPYGGHGKSIPGTPEQFSDEWWDFFSFAAKECEKYDMSVGMGDYTIAWIGNGYFTDKLSGMPDMHAKNMSIAKKMLFSGDEEGLSDDVLVALYYKDIACEEPVIIYEKDKGICSPIPGICEAYIVSVHETDKSIDPLNPGCGKILTEIYFEEFFRRVPDVKEGVLNYFFQDELMFGTDIKTIWGESLRNGIREKYGYDVIGFLPHLFYNLGDITPKIRLDVSDIRTLLTEENYFKPIYEFHASKNLIYGCDQSSRGKEPDEFSDYFRTVRWFTAPGNDTPGRAADLIKVKVNSSIAHLYGRPRVWLEGYHSSGWGTTLESITAPTSDNFIYGANLLNLHGLYYSTNGGFFEWAPPDFHFRMPYWDDEKQWLDKYKRMSAILTAGRHKCDVAVYYPVSSCEYGENHKFCTEKTFECAEYLFSKGLDFDFIDFQSIESAACENGRLKTSYEDYKVLIFAGVDCVRFSAIQKAEEFIKNGGCVVFCGNTPYASDRKGLNDPVLNDTIKRILSSPSASLTPTAAETLAFINSVITRSFLPEDIYSEEKIYVHRRYNGSTELYFVRYAKKDSVCRFEAQGTPYLLDTYEGKIIRLDGTVYSDGFTFVKMPLEENDDTILLFTDDEISFDDIIDTSDSRELTEKQKIYLDGDWDFTLVPTLDNKYGDYYLPEGGIIGAQARFFDITKISDGDDGAGFEFNDIPFGTNTAIRRIYCKDESFSLCREISKHTDIPETNTICLNNKDYTIETQQFYSRYGYICTDDYTVSLHEQGHHGLKGHLYDDNIFFEDDCVYITNVYAEEDCEAVIHTGDIIPDLIILNSEEIRTDRVHLKKGKNPLFFSYTYRSEESVNYRNSGKIKRTSLHITKQDAKESNYPLSVPSFANPDYFRFSSTDEDIRYFCFRFSTVPGFISATVDLFGNIHTAFIGSREAETEFLSEGESGSKRYRIKAPAAEEYITDVVFYAEAENGFEYADMLARPVDIECTKGKITAGDTSHMGALKNYSGKMVYEKNIVLSKLYPDERFILDLGDAAATAKVEINGKTARIFTFRPFRTDITDYAVNGENHIKITVSNTLCNHYSTIPSKYSNFPKDAASGLIGPVSIRVVERI